MSVEHQNNALACE